MIFAREMVSGFCYNGWSGEINLMSIEPWFPPATATLVLWGIMMFLPKLAVRNLPPLHLAVYSAFFSLVAAFGLTASRGFELEFDGKGVVLAVCIGILGRLGGIMYLIAIRNGPMTYGAVITSLYPVITAALSFFILHETLTMRQMAGIVLGICSLVLMVMAHDAPEPSSGVKRKGGHVGWLLPSLAGLVFWGIWAFIPKIALQTLSPYSTVFYESLGDLVVGIPILIYLKGKLMKDRMGISLTALGSTVSIVALVAYFYAMKSGPVATVVTMTSLYPVITLIMARVFLHEKINRVQCAAIGMAMAAVGLLAG